MLNIRGLDMICEICDAKVTAYTLRGEGMFIRKHFHGGNAQEEM